MKANEIREMSTEELLSKVSELKEQLFVLKFQQATGQQAELSKRKSLRKDIARILTILKERELANK